MDILSKIIKKKREELEYLKKNVSISELEKSIYFNTKTNSLVNSIKNKDISIIAEHKRKSPSKSDINHLTSTKDVVHGYEHGGAVGISFLTEKNFFDGSVEDFKEARKITKLPLLRKDFIIDEYQIYQSRYYGADCILLIVAALSDSQLKEYKEISESLNLDVLVEIHDEEELSRIDNLDFPLIGINNRNLRTFEVDLETSNKLSQNLDGKLIVSESGIKTREDIDQILSYKIFNFLVGESFMRAKNPGSELHRLFFS